MKSNSGQVSLELLVLGILMIAIFQFVIIPSANYIESSSRDLNSAGLADAMVASLASSVDLIGASGVGSKRSFQVMVPDQLIGVDCDGTKISAEVNIYMSTLSNSSSKGFVHLEHTTDPKIKEISKDTSYQITNGILCHELESNYKGRCASITIKKNPSNQVEFVSVGSCH